MRHLLFAGHINVPEEEHTGILLRWLLNRQPRRKAAAEKKALEKQEKEYRAQLIQDLACCRSAIIQNESFFNMAEDFDTVESCIWQHKALLAREDMLTDKIKNLQVDFSAL